MFDFSPQMFVFIDDDLTVSDGDPVPMVPLGCQTQSMYAAERLIA